MVIVLILNSKGKGKVLTRSDNSSNYDNTTMVQVNLEPVSMEIRKERNPLLVKTRKSYLF